MADEPAIGAFPWEIDPHLVKPPFAALNTEFPETMGMATLHEGTIMYERLWNFWVRSGEIARFRNNSFFYNLESIAAEVRALFDAIGIAMNYPATEDEVWNRTSNLWNWLGDNVRVDAAYGDLIVGRWPSIVDFARYYRDHGNLVWAACFSKAHLFATLLSRMLPRWCVFIAKAHHIENGAPPTASHVYVGLYLTGRWFYLDPTAVHSQRLPSFARRQSVGVLRTVDYQHPHTALPVPRSPLNRVPHLPA